MLVYIIIPCHSTDNGVDATRLVDAPSCIMNEINFQHASDEDVSCRHHGKLRNTLAKYQTHHEMNSYCVVCYFANKLIFQLLFESTVSVE